MSSGVGVMGYDMGIDRVGKDDRDGKDDIGDGYRHFEICREYGDMGRERCGKKDWDMVWMGKDGARTRDCLGKKWDGGGVLG